MPTGCKSVYLIAIESESQQELVGEAVPAGDLESRTEDLGPHELRHCCGILVAQGMASVLGGEAEQALRRVVARNGSSVHCHACTE